MSLFLAFFGITNLAYADDSSFAFEFKQLNSEFSAQADNDSRKAKLNSGLAFSYDHQAIDLSLDYTLQGDLTSHAATQNDGELSQIVQGALRSPVLNETLGGEAFFIANSRIGEAGDTYQHNFSTEFARPLFSSVDLNLSYDVGISKKAAYALSEQVNDYSFGLAGELGSGRLAWSSQYGETRTTLGKSSHANTTNALMIDSKVLVATGVQLYLSGLLKKQAIASEQETEFLDEMRYAAGIFWSPSSHYSVSFKLNKLQTSVSELDEYFGSGAITWQLNPKKAVQLRYDDYLLSGTRGVMLDLTFDLGK